MASLVGLPTLDMTIVRPKRPMIDIVGAGLEGGRNGLGESNAIEFAGGGMLSLSYDCAAIQKPEHHAYFSDLAGRLNGSFRNINVPILSDWIAGVARKAGVPVLEYVSLFDPDGSLVDSALPAKAAASAVITEVAASGAGKVKIRIVGADNSFGPPRWFSVLHPTKGFRAYRIWDVLGTTGSAAEPIYEAAIGPALRQAVAADTAANVVRPKFAGRFPAGFTLPYAPDQLGWIWEPTLQFVEAF